MRLYPNIVIIREDNASVEEGILSSDTIEVDMGKPCADNAVLGDEDITSLVAQHGNYYVKFWTKGCYSYVSPSVEWARIHVDVQQTLDIDFNYGASTALEAAVSDGNSSDLLRIRSGTIGSPTVCGAKSI